MTPTLPSCTWDIRLTHQSLSTTYSVAQYVQKDATHVHGAVRVPAVILDLIFIMRVRMRISVRVRVRAVVVPVLLRVIMIVVTVLFANIDQFADFCSVCVCLWCRVVLRH